jgi:hypothetical protein
MAKMKKMYVAVALNAFDMKMYGHSAKSPYSQSAIVFFSTNLPKAKARAKKLLGHSPAFVRQIGRINVDVSGSERHPEIAGAPHVNGQEFHVMDMNDTNEGCLVTLDARAEFCPTHDLTRKEF